MSGRAGAGALPTAPCRILGLGTGTGAIACAGQRTSGLRGHRGGRDAGRCGAGVAQRNAEHLGIANVTISQSDWFSALDGQRSFATIVSNPPISTP